MAGTEAAIGAAAPSIGIPTRRVTQKTPWIMNRLNDSLLTL